MQEELIRMLRAVPFYPFIICTRDGEAEHVDSVERLSVGKNVCAYVDTAGYISLIPYTAIDRIITRDSPEIM